MLCPITWSMQIMYPQGALSNHQNHILYTFSTTDVWTWPRDSVMWTPTSKEGTGLFGEYLFIFLSVLPKYMDIHNHKHLLLLVCTKYSIYRFLVIVSILKEKNSKTLHSEYTNIFYVDLFLLDCVDIVDLTKGQCYVDSYFQRELVCLGNIYLSSCLCYLRTGNCFVCRIFIFFLLKV